MPQRQPVPSRRSLLAGLPSVAAFTALVTAVAVAPGQLPRVEQEVITATGGGVETNTESMAIPRVQRAANEPGSDPSTTPDAKQPTDRSATATSSATAEASSSPSPSPSPAEGSAPDAPTSEPAQPPASSENSSTAPAATKSATEKPTSHADHADQDDRANHPPAARPGGPRVLAALEPDATAEYQMLGVTWRDPAAEVDFTVEVRTRDTSGWSDWTELHHTGDGENVNEPGARGGTAPMWVGDSDGAAVRVLGNDAPPADLSLELIDTGEGNRANTTADLMASTSMPNIIRRSAWNGGTAPSNSCSSRYGDTVRAVTVHHTVGPNSYSRSQSDNLVRGIHRYHTQSQGWCDIGYNFLIDRYGRIYEGRGGGINRPVRGAHAGDWEVNEESTGVSLMGRFDTGYPTAAMRRALVDFTAWRLSSYNRNPTGTAQIGGRSYPVIMGHRDVKATACPGGHVYDWLPQLRRQVKNAIDSGGPGAIEEKAESLRWDPVTRLRADWGGEYRVYQQGAIYDSANTNAQAVRGAILAKYRSLGQGGSALSFPTSDERNGALSGSHVSNFQRGSIYHHRRTGAHEVRGAILAKYRALDGTGGLLGLPITGEGPAAAPGSSASDFENGTIYHHRRTGPHEIHGLIKRKYLNLGGTNSFLGMPASDEVAGSAAGSRMSEFENGRIYHHPKTGQHEVHGRILNKYVDLGGSGSMLGLPTSDERNGEVPGSRVSVFQDGRIYHHRKTGPHEVHGLILRKYQRLGGPGSLLGLPVSDEGRAAARGSRASDFQGGTIYHHPRTGPHEIHGLIKRKYLNLGGTKSFLGLPTSDEVAGSAAGSRVSKFEDGRIYHHRRTGPHEVHGLILRKYLAIGGSGSRLGLPTSDEFSAPRGPRSNFENGYILRNTGTRRTTVHYD